MNLEKYDAFIEEQKNYFNQNLQSNFKWDWNDSSWYGGTIGSGWLLSRSGKTHFTFSTIKKLKGIENNIIEPIFQEFIKSVLILGEFKHEVRQFQKPYDNQQAEQISLMV